MWADERQAVVERHWKSAERLRAAGVKERCWGSNIYVALAEVHEERARQLEKEARTARAAPGRQVSPKFHLFR